MLAASTVTTIAIATLIISMTLGAITIQSIKAQPRPTQLPVLPNNLPVETVQDDHHIVTTVTKSGGAPEGPIVVIPPSAGHGNGSIITPGENVTAEHPGNITVISPGGNVTELPGNITNVDNETVIIAPPDRNITEVPITPSENITIISPPHATQLPVFGNESGSGTHPGQPCTCNQSKPIPPVTITPAPGQNVTTLPHPLENATANPPMPFPPTNQSGGGAEQQPASNETNTGNNQTGNAPGNETSALPANNSTNAQPPHATQLPAVTTIIPGYHINAISYNYNGPNSQWLHR